jgi:hypothetical protein
MEGQDLHLSYLQRFGARYVKSLLCTAVSLLRHLPIAQASRVLPPLAGWGIRPPSYRKRSGIFVLLLDIQQCVVPSPCYTLNVVWLSSVHYATSLTVYNLRPLVTTLVVCVQPSSNPNGEHVSFNSFHDISFI